MTENGKLFAIAILAVTAVLLLCTILILDRMPTPAYAGTSPDRPFAADYLLIPGGTIQGDDCVYVIDMAVQEVGVYKADPNKIPQGIIPVAKLDLK